MVSVGPHEFARLRRFFNKGRCRACFYHERNHPVPVYSPGRAIGDKSPADRKVDSRWAVVPRPEEAE